MDNKIEERNEEINPVRELDEEMLKEALEETSIGIAGAVQVEYDAAM